MEQCMSLLSVTAPEDLSAFDQFVTAQELTGFKPKANHADDQLFHASLASIIKHLREMPGRHSEDLDNTFRVSLGFVEDVRPNALANKHGNVHIAAVHTGLAMVIMEFAWFCLAQADVFPEIGDPSQETSPKSKAGLPPGLSVLIQTVQSDGAQDAHINAPIIPRDPHRHAAAHYLALLMMRFVWLHEIGHGGLGHIDYLQSFNANSEGKSLGLNELSLNELVSIHPRIDGRVLQCLEFEADSWALYQSFLVQHAGQENIDGIAALPADLRCRMTLFAIYSMSWLMETISSTFSRGRLAITHPAPIRRMQMLQNMAVWELNDLDLNIPALTRQALGMFQTVLSQIGAQWLQTDQFDPHRYRKIFEETRDKLAPFRYVVPEDAIRR
ncbi:hypothetical protein BKI51_02435 [Alphaproteobacteria bacterium AO1-B]|nr:hypothetical protein BKI51_02435 [Alphaproteobacteria bacterium AO1-B]